MGCPGITGRSVDQSVHLEPSGRVFGVIICSYKRRGNDHAHPTIK